MCLPCRLFGQFLLNLANLLDHALNFLALGDADETVSARVARARNAGKRWAFRACQFLTFATKLVTNGKVTRNHCDYALDKMARPNSREIWNWCTNSINVHPINVVEVIDDGPDSAGAVNIEDKYPGIEPGHSA